jgi:hypothetical protein
MDLACNIAYAAASVIALAGSVKVYLKWDHGDKDILKTATRWFGAAVFIVIVATIVKTFLGD